MGRRGREETEEPSHSPGNRAALDQGPPALQAQLPEGGLGSQPPSTEDWVPTLSQVLCMYYLLWG